MSETDVEPPKALPVRVVDVRARIEKMIAENKDNLEKMSDPIRWLMAEEMKAARGGLSPVFLRPLVTIAFYGNDAIPRLMEIVQRECAAMRIFMSGEQLVDLNKVESAMHAIIEGLRSKYAKEASKQDEG